MKILVMSDTHGLLRPEVREMLGNCDAVIHSGDFHTQEIVREMKGSVRTGVPVFLVRGNVDGDWAASLPDHLEFALDGVKFYVVHDRKDLPQDLGACQIVICGHSHKYQEEWRDGRLYLNPGGCGRRRFRLDLTMAVLHLKDGRISAEKVEISGGRRDGRTADLPGNRLGMIREIMRRMEKGQQIGKISRELKLEQEFVEEICRICVTHPGVSAEGILDKTEVNHSVCRLWE